MKHYNHQPGLSHVFGRDRITAYNDGNGQKKVASKDKYTTLLTLK
jgi:hypothetical protein